MSTELLDVDCAPLQPADRDKFSEQQARDWLAANADSPKTVREIAELWGWHRSSVQRFLSRVRGQTPETNAETNAKAPETSETAETSTPAPGFIIPRPDDFDWSPTSPDLVAPGQPALAAYVNSFGQIVIRQQAQWEEDPFIVVSPTAVPRLIAKLRSLLAELADGS
jgi:hypothetical protein